MILELNDVSEVQYKDVMMIDDGSLCPVIDYRALNGITIKNCYPIPQIADLIESLSHASIFIKINLRWEYNNVHIKKGGE